MTYSEHSQVVSVFSDDYNAIASYELDMIARFNHNLLLPQNKFKMKVDIRTCRVYKLLPIKKGSQIKMIADDFINLENIQFNETT